MKKTVIKLSIFFLTISLGYSQGVINSEKLFNSEVEKFYFILSPTIDIQSGNSEVLETGLQFSSLYKIRGGGGVKEIRKNTVLSLENSNPNSREHYLLFTIQILKNH